MTWPKRMSPILAPCTKTGEEKRVYINDAMYDILSKRISALKSGSDLIFHKDGKALRYNHIQRNYNKALQTANVDFTGTHILRHGMATTTRHLLGLNHSQAVTGHKSIRMLEHYAENNNFELNKESVIHVEKFLNEKLSEAKIVTNCDH